MASEWETIIGLEVHCELASATKLFCGCPNRFGDEPNTNVCPVCLGLPGSLPVLNEQVVELAVRLGRALHCEVRRSVFSRKNYFYPDMPKDYQISQYDLPINSDGYLDLPDGGRIGIERAHLEEDTGKSTHVGGGGRIHDASYSLVDYNRAGVALLEIVSRPDLRSAEDARAYVSELRAILLATGASDAKMEEGSLRVDANVSVHHPDEPFGTRCEIKNLNSLRSLGRAIEYEARRQVDLIEAGDTVRQETRHWNEAEGRTGTLRVKEEAEDYRYFPEPDLVPLDPGDEWVARVDAALPPLPAARRERLAAAAGLAEGPASGAVATAVARNLDELALGAIEAGADAGRVLTHVEQNLAVDGAESHQARRPGGAGEDGDRRRADRHPGQGRAGRHGELGRVTGRDRQGQGVRGHGRRRHGRRARRGHRRPPRRVGPLPRGRRQGPGQAHRLLRRPGDEGHQGPGQRQRGHGAPAPARLLLTTPACRASPGEFG